jgi:hypothetical protein
MSETQIKAIDDLLLDCKKCQDDAELQKIVDKLYKYCQYMTNEHCVAFEKHCLKLAANKYEPI